MFRWVQKCKGYNHEILLVRNNRVIRMYPEKLDLVMRGKRENREEEETSYFMTLPISDLTFVTSHTRCHETKA